jgi:hypothetical protein
VPLELQDRAQLGGYFGEVRNFAAGEMKPTGLLSHRALQQCRQTSAKTLFDVRLAPAGQNKNPTYDVSADGRFPIATPVEQSATVPMTVVVNWQAPLQK